MKKSVTSYGEKLKDPRWQKKRLQIMERDQWKCVLCNSKVNTLNVHHIYYENGLDPWDYEDDVFVTLCETCHKRSTKEQAKFTMLMWKLINKKWNQRCIDLLIGLTLEMGDGHQAHAVMETFLWAIKHKIPLQRLMMDRGYHASWGEPPYMRPGKEYREIVMEIDKTTTLAQNGSPDFIAWFTHKKPYLGNVLRLMKTVLAPDGFTIFLDSKHSYLKDDKEAHRAIKAALQEYCGYPIPMMLEEAA